MNRGKTFARKRQKFSSADDAPDVIAVSSSSCASHSEQPETQEDSDDNSQPPECRQPAGGYKPPGCSSPADSRSDGAKPRKKRRKKAKQEADPTQRQLHYPVRLDAEAADAGYESAPGRQAGPQASREPPGNAAAEAAAEKPAPKRSHYFSDTPARKPAASRASSEGRDNISISLGTESRPGAVKDTAGQGFVTAEEGSEDLFPPHSPAHGHSRSAAAADAELMPNWFATSTAAPAEASPNPSGAGSQRGSPASLQIESPLAGDEPLTIPKTPGSPPAGGALELPSQSPEPAGTSVFMRTLLTKAQQRRQQKKRGAAADASPLLLSPSPKSGQKKRRKGGKRGGAGRRSGSRARESRSPSPSRWLDLEKPGTDSPQHEDMRVALWEPPVSPFFLIEEALYNDPWRLLVACMLLNKTTGRAVRKILWRLFELAPTPEAAATVDTAQVEAIIQPLGLFRKRALMFKRFSQEYLETNWTDPQQLHGIGRYAADAYYIFCRNQWREREPPQDKDLLKYYEWLLQTEGQGSGHEREVFRAPAGDVASPSTA